MCSHALCRARRRSLLLQQLSASDRWISVAHTHGPLTAIVLMTAAYWSRPLILTGSRGKRGSERRRSPGQTLQDSSPAKFFCQLVHSCLIFLPPSFFKPPRRIKILLPDAEIVLEFYVWMISRQRGSSHCLQPGERRACPQLHHRTSCACPWVDHQSKRNRNRKSFPTEAYFARSSCTICDLNKETTLPADVIDTTVESAFRSSRSFA